MRRAFINDIELEYELSGKGEPVVLIHPGIFADWFTPLLREPALTEHYSLLHYHRVGSAGSSHVTGPVSLARHAAHARLLMNELGIDRAHVVGHSSSALVALQLALDAPERVHSLSLLEPPLMSVPSAATSRAFVGAALQLYRAGDRAAAIDTFLQGVCGAEYRLVLDRELPHGFAQYVADADSFFEQEFPALQSWSFTRQDASRITQPALALVGGRSLERDPIWAERQQLLLDWLPNVEPVVIADTAHLLEVENPVGIARGLADFFARHPVAVIA